ncbi:hypothetical protein L1987_07753 [Smallanthus sonchifolius]|uniref:Uncharacterized protein n=1 Tax=Smallanthus sonchifolius TaxID=185202 RepID=A0ACB9JKD4_9ASTR|nr:hypothetical protein L1987_07753 [Smallanthus sonchifolius]
MWKDKMPTHCVLRVLLSSKLPKLGINNKVKGGLNYDGIFVHNHRVISKLAGTIFRFILLPGWTNFGPLIKYGNRPNRIPSMWRRKRIAGPNVKLNSKPIVICTWCQGDPDLVIFRSLATIKVSYWAILLDQHNEDFCSWEPSFEEKHLNLMLAHLYTGGQPLFRVMNPSGGPIPPSKQPPDPFLEDPSVAPSIDSPKIVDVPCAIEVQSEVPLVPSANGVHSESHPRLATDGHSISTPPLIGDQREKPHSRASLYDRGSSGGAARRKGTRMLRREKPQSKYSPLLSELRVAEFIQETSSIGAQELPLSMRLPIPSPPVDIPSPLSDPRVVPEHPNLVRIMDFEMANQVDPPISMSPGAKSGLSGSPQVPAEKDIPHQASGWPRSLTSSVSYADRCKGISDAEGSKLQYIPPIFLWMRPGIDVDPVPLPRAVNIPSSAVPTATGTVLVPVKVVETPAMVQEEDGFTIVNRKGKKKAVKLQKKKKQVVVRTNSIGQKPNQRSPTMSDELHNHSVGTAGSIKSRLGFDFTRAVQGANVKTKKPPNQSPSTSLQPARAASRSANRHPSLRLLQWMWSLPKLHRATGLQL